MKILKWLGIGAGAMIVVLLAVGFALDSHIELHLDKTVQGDADRMYALVSSPAGVKWWWADAGVEYGKDVDNMTIEHKDGASGPGAKVAFKVGGTLYEEWTLVSLKPGQEVVWGVDFQMFVVRRTLRLKRGEEGVAASWHETGEVGNPLMRVMMKAMSTDEVLQNWDKALQMLARRTQAKGFAALQLPAAATAS